MGKVTGGPEMKRKKKKGRPSLSDPNTFNNYINNPPILNSDNSTPNLKPRSSRRNPNSATPYSDSDSDERQQKKVKLVVRLPTSNSTSPDRSEPVDDDVVLKDEKGTEVLQGSPLESGPTAPLPNKKLLLFILDRLQKKDTYGVFSEPVDPKELPDYHEIIEHPMDFGTVRRKLDEGNYANLDDFESDVNLICANAMQYNGSDSVYFRQAKSIQDIAKRDFYNLRQVNDEGEPQPRIVRRGRPSNLLKALNNPMLDRVGPESSSDATLATAVDNNNIDTDNNTINNNAVVGANAYNLRKVVPSLRFQSTDTFFKASAQPRNNGTYADYTTDWNSEFPAKLLKAEAKYGKKQFSADENRRNTYKQFHPSAFGLDPSSLTTLDGNMKHLIGVGLYSDHGYARSLARFAANLGPVVWKVASKKIESALPSGVNFGPGWVGEHEALPPQPQPQPQPSVNTLVHDSNNEQFVPRNNVPIIRTGPIMDAQQKHLLHNQNGLNQLSGDDFLTQAEMLRARLNLPVGGQQFGIQEAYPTAPNHSSTQINIGGSSTKSPRNILAPPACENVLSQQHRPFTSVIPVPPDLNVRFQAPASPNSSFRIGSPQPDLALQL